MILFFDEEAFDNQFDADSGQPNILSIHKLEKEYERMIKNGKATGDTQKDIEDAIDNHNIPTGESSILTEAKREIVKCSKCGGDCGLYLRGEPVYICKSCGAYNGTANRDGSISEAEDPLYFLSCDMSEEEREVLNKSINRIIESSNEIPDERLHPVYIVVSYTNTPMGKLIKAWTKDEYTHACVSFDPSLQKMYSFNKADAINKHSGLSLESLDEYIDIYRDTKIQVSAVFLKTKEYKDLVKRFDDYLSNYKLTSYSLTNIFNIATNRKSYGDYFSMVCSQFVDSLFKFISVDLTNGKSSNLVTPGDISRSTNGKVYILYEGLALNYDADKIASRVNRMLTTGERLSPLKEAVQVLYEIKEFPVQFDEDGNLLISKKEKINFLSEYKKTNKLRPFYVKYNNLEGMKYELAKLWYLNLLLYQLIELDDKEKETYVALRSKILTEFSLYMKEISKIDNRFNFSTYYETTPFSDVKIKVNGTTLKYTGKYVSDFLKSIF